MYPDLKLVDSEFGPLYIRMVGDEVGVFWKTATYKREIVEGGLAYHRTEEKPYGHPKITRMLVRAGSSDEHPWLDDDSSNWDWLAPKDALSLANQLNAAAEYAQANWERFA